MRLSQIYKKGNGLCRSAITTRTILSETVSPVAYQYLLWSSRAVSDPTQRIDALTSSPKPTAKSSFIEVNANQGPYPKDRWRPRIVEESRQDAPRRHPPQPSRGSPSEEPQPTTQPQQISILNRASKTTTANQRTGRRTGTHLRRTGSRSMCGRSIRRASWT